MDLSPTRQNFRSALTKVQEYKAGSLGVTPAVHSYPGAALARRPLAERVAPRRAEASRGMTVRKALDGMGSGTLTATSLAKDSLAAMQARNGRLNAFVHVAPTEQILAEAGRMDVERQAGRLRGPLHGIPISVKDVIHVAGMPTTASSRVLAGFMPGEDAAAVALLRRAGALILGKTHTHEFALGVTTPQSRNPHDETRDPGGSSGGSAIAVATGMGLASLGTDTRASIRVPAALSGTVGYKPTYGLVPTQGIVTLSWSLDHAAPMANTIEDIGILLDVLATQGPPDQLRRYAQAVHKDVRGLRVGVPKNSLTGAEPGVLKRFRAAADGLRAEEVEVLEIEQPTAEDFTLANAMGLIVSRVEAAAYHRTFNADPALYTQAVADQLDEASKVSGSDYVQAQRWRAEFQNRMRDLFSRFDALLMPTSRVVSPRREEAERFFLVLSENCIPWSFIGFPAVSVPCGLTDERLPVGAELVAGPWEDDRLLALASALEAGADRP